MFRLTRWVVRHPWITLGVFFLATLGFMSQMPRLRVETDIGAALPKSLPVKRLYDEVGERFPSKDVIFVVLEHPDVFHPDIVAQVDRLTNRLYRVPGVYDVISPTNVSVIEGTAEGVQVVPALEGDPHDPEVLKRFEERLFASDFVGNLVAQDRQGFGLLVLLKQSARPKVTGRAVLDLVDSLRTATGLEFHATGRPVLEYLLAQGLGRDMHVFFSLVIVVVGLILWLSFRSLRGVLLPFTVVLSSVVWTLGTMALLGVPLSHSTEFMPVLLISIGIADSIHILHTYYHLRREYHDRKQLVLETMRLLNLPVTMTSLTTAVAFLALGFAGFTSLKQLGATVAYGVIVAMLFSLYVLPAFLAVLKVPRRAFSEERMGWLHGLMQRLGVAIVRHRGATLALMGLVTLFFALGIPRVKVENNTVENFPKGHEARIAYEIVSRHFAGPEVLTVVVRGHGPGALKDPVLLQEMDRFKAYMLKQRGVGNVTSIADLVKRLHQVINGGNPAYYRVPDTLEIVDGDTLDGRALVAQYLALYSLSARPGELERMVTPDFDMARMDVFVKEGRMTLIDSVDHAARRFIQSDFERAREVDLTGTPEILLTINHMVVTGQTKSILVSILLVFLLVVLAFRSWVAGLYGILPLTFAMIVNFGIMGWLGLYANIENMVTSNIAIGVGIDYMIHFLHRFRREYRQGHDLVEVTRRTFDTSGVAILLNALTVALGFATIMASMFRAVSTMGFLISLAMISTCVGALTFLPALLAVFRPRFLERR